MTNDSYLVVQGWQECQRTFCMSCSKSLSRWFTGRYKGLQPRFFLEFRFIHFLRITKIAFLIFPDPIIYNYLLSWVSGQKVCLRNFINPVCNIFISGLTLTSSNRDGRVSRFRGDSISNSFLSIVNRGFFAVRGCPRNSCVSTWNLGFHEEEQPRRGRYLFIYVGKDYAYLVNLGVDLSVKRSTNRQSRTIRETDVFVRVSNDREC